VVAGGEGTAPAAPPREPGEDVYRVDPAVGLAALPWDWTTPTPPTPPDLSPDDHRALCWTTAPYPGGLRITGQLEAVVVLSADRPDVILRACLPHLPPRAFSTLISHGPVPPPPL